MRALVFVLLVACRSGDTETRVSPDGTYVLKPSLQDGNVRITVSEKTTGKVIDDTRTGDTDQMKWVTGWVDNTTFLFWGSDTGTRWMRRIDGAKVTEHELDAVACKRLEDLFEQRYGERRGNCLRH